MQAFTGVGSMEDVSLIAGVVYGTLERDVSHVNYTI
uniref:Uncharacterized protein n=1 Tax=Anguilla anguilla TaxID=7936 RepID=A0A0E9Y2T9_ANGAN